MIYLVFYDISTNAIRTKIAKRLVAEGYERIQLSVFVGIRHPKQNTALWNTLNDSLKNEPTAKFFVINLSVANFQNMSIIGQSDLDILYLIGKKNTIFI